MCADSLRLLLVILGLTGTLVTSTLDLDVDRYDDVMLQGLYKRLSEIDSRYFLNGFDEGGDGYRTVRDDELSSLDRAAIRDAEYIEHSSHGGNEGFLQMSGGAGEGKQHLMPDGSIDNVQPEGSSIVKSDKSLPFYCHPPNPCPKGYTSENGCDETVEDTAEAQKDIINGMQQSGVCVCDQEHMFNCPINPPATSDNKGRDGLNEVVDKILSDKAAATYMSGEKRQTLVAKKSPRMRRGVKNSKDHKEEKKVNPYLTGERLRTVAKKG